MKSDKNIQEIISKYLGQTETTEERAQLYQWFDDAGDAGAQLDEEAVADSLLRSRQRLFAQISSDHPVAAKRKLNWYKIAAACIVLVLFSVSLKFLTDRNGLTPVSNAELARIMPDHKKATLTLSTGEVYHLDGLENSQSVAIGKTILRKDALGQLVYASGDHQAVSKVINTLQTAKATQYTVILSDGTKVNLNATSKLSFPQEFGSGDRVVELQGEAYFEVMKTAAHSKFIVKTDGQSIEVLGTKFNVRAYKDQAFVKTTLTEGSVRISPVNKSLKTVMLKPNQQATLKSDGIELTRVNTTKISEWKEGYFVFDGSDSERTIREIGQWYGIEIDYQPKNGKIEYEGKIPKNLSLASLIELLKYADMKVGVYKNKDHQYKLTIN